MPIPFIRVTHNGLYPDGRPNTASILLDDIRYTGQYNQNVKTQVYVRPNSFVDLPVTTDVTFSFEQGAISKFAAAGAVTAVFIDPGGGVDSVFGRSGVVAAQAGDYSASLVSNDSGVAGADVAAALDQLDADITAAVSAIRIDARRGADPGEVPGGQTLNIGAFEVRANQSQFSAGVNERFSGIFRIPDNADITQPVTYFFEYVIGNLDQAASDIFFVFYRSLVSDGDRIDGTQTPASTSFIIVNVPANASLLRFRTSVTFDISGAIPGDSVAWALERFGSSDSFGGAVTVPLSDFFILEPA